MSQTPVGAIALEKLKDSGLALADGAQDITGRKVVDRDGVDIGHISDLFVDEDHRKVRMLEIHAGGILGLGERHFLLPVDAISSIDKDEVHVSETQDRVSRSPAYDPNLIVAPTIENWEPFYGYYGLSPYWGMGYRYPDFALWQRQVR